MDLSVVVVSWNTRDLLRDCLASIERTVTDLVNEIIVVDNGSADGSCAMVSSEFPRVRLLRNEANRGFAEANNQAILIATGRYVLLLNSDAMLCGDTARRMVDFLDAQPAVGVVGGKLLNPDGSFQSSYATFPTMWGELLLQTGLSKWLLPSTYPSYPEHLSATCREADWVGGALLMARHAACSGIGLLDRGYFMYAEEMDWCYRMKRGGWKVFYLPEAAAIHHAGGSSARVPEKKRGQLYRSQCRFLRLHRGPIHATSFRALVMLATVVKLVGWLAVGTITWTGLRGRARQHVAAHRFVLDTFMAERWWQAPSVGWCEQSPWPN